MLFYPAASIILIYLIVNENLVQHPSNNILIETKILPNYYFQDMNVCVSLDGLGLTAILTSMTVPTTRVRTMVSVLMKLAGTLVSARLDSLAKIANTLWIIARYKVFSVNKKNSFIERQITF